MVLLNGEKVNILINSILAYVFMILCVDIGNSFHHCVVFACAKEPVRVFEKKYPLIEENALTMILQSFDIKQIMMASVVPSGADFWWQQAQNYHISCHVITHQDRFSFAMDVDYPEKVGIDRLLNLQAVRSVYPTQDVCVFDSGTALTCDILVNEVFRGGMIIAGSDLNRKSLAEKTACLPLVDFATQRPDMIGRHTEKAIQAGLYWGQIAMIEGVIQRLKEQYPKMLFVATGGGLAFCYQQIKNLDYYDDYLLIKGILSLLDFTTDQKKL